MVVGVPPDQAIKLITINIEQGVEDIKKTIKRVYKLNPIFAIQLIFKGKLLPENKNLRKIVIHPEKDTITIMNLMGGGSNQEMKCKVLSDDLKLSEAKILPTKDEICVTSTQSGAGKREMKCLQCGTTNVNEMLVSFIAEDESGRKYEDTTTLPKFLYYLEYPSDKRGKKIHQPTPYRITKIRNYCCTKCYSNKLVEGKRGEVGLRIPSRRFGIFI